MSSSSTEWNWYWRHQNSDRHLYGQIASFYRRRIIAPSLRRTLSRLIREGDSLLHIGAGSGELDVTLPISWSLISLDFSSAALERHRANHQREARESKAVQGDLFQMPFTDLSFKVVFNLGLMEHLTDKEVVLALKEMQRVAQVGGSVVLYWPPVWGPSVIFLHTLARLFQVIREAPERLHPPEINLFRSRKATQTLLRELGFDDVTFLYGIGDLFTHVVVIARKL